MCWERAIVAKLLSFPPFFFPFLPCGLRRGDAGVGGPFFFFFFFFSALSAVYGVALEGGHRFRSPCLPSPPFSRLGQWLLKLFFSPSSLDDRNGYALVNFSLPPLFLFSSLPDLVAIFCFLFPPITENCAEASRVVISLFAGRRRACLSFPSGN